MVGEWEGGGGAGGGRGLLGGRGALIQAIQPPGYNGVQAWLLHQGVTAHVTLSTPHQISPLPLSSRLQPQSVSRRESI